MKKYLIALAVIILLIIIAGAVYLKLTKPVEPELIACTKEAKLCPDGSSVGRTGPNCEFEECPFTPDAIDEMADWKTYKNDKFEFSYPDNWALSFGRDQGEIISFSLTSTDGIDQITLAPLTLKITCAKMQDNEPKGNFRCEEIKNLVYFIVYQKDSSLELFDEIKKTIKTF